jgi:hypothetical protein
MHHPPEGERTTARAIVRSGIPLTKGQRSTVTANLSSQWTLDKELAEQIRRKYRLMRKWHDKDVKNGSTHPMHDLIMWRSHQPFSHPKVAESPPKNSPRFALVCA